MLLAAKVSPDDFSLYSYFQITVSTLGAYGSLGLGVVAVRYGAGLSVGDLDSGKLLGAVWTVSLLAALTAAAVVVMAPPALLGLDGDEIRMFASLAVFAIVAGVVPVNAVIGMEGYRSILLTSTISSIAVVVGAMFAVIASKISFAIGMLAISFLIQAAGGSIVIFRSAGFQNVFGSHLVGRRAYSRIGAFAGPMFLVTILAATAPWIVGRSIIHGADGELEFARFAIGMQWFALGMLIPGMVSRVTLPRVLKALSETSDSVDEGAKSTVKLGASLAVASAVAVSVFGLAISPMAIGFYGPVYAHDRWLIAIYMLAAVPSASANVIGNAIIARDEQILWLKLTAAFFGLAITIALYSRSLGALSGAISLGGGYAALTLLAYMAARKREFI